MKSKKKLFKTLDAIRNTGTMYQTLGLKAKGIFDETYGHESYIYIGSGNMDERKVLESKLMDEGFRVSRRYAPMLLSTEVQVSYFKGYNHYE